MCNYKIIPLLLLMTSLKAQSLRELVPNGKYIGTTINANYFDNLYKNDKEYDSIIKSQFNGIVAESNYKMGQIIPNEPKNPFRLTLKDINAKYLDQLIQFGQENKMTIRGHCLIWQNDIPRWLSKLAKNWNNKQIYDFTKQYISLVVGYTKGKIKEWDVVNEVIDDRGPKFRSNTWFDNVIDKQDFINQCFVHAKKADSKALLFLNDYSIEGFQERPDSRNYFMLDMVKNMKKNKIPIDGVGLQCHLLSGILDEGYIFSIGRTIDEITSMGLKCSITEFDIRICNLQNTPSRQQLEVQKQEYQKMIQLFLVNKGVTGITFWGFTDKLSWIPKLIKNCGGAHLYDANYKTKPAYQGVIEGLTILKQLGQKKPRNNQPISIPGTIEFENYDQGGKGISYMEREEINSGNFNERNDAVDLSQENNNIVLGYTEAGEWLEYTVNIQKTGFYSFEISNCSAAITNGQARIEIDGLRVGDSFTFIPNGDWSKYKEDTFNTIRLPSGIHTLRFYIEKGAVNLDKMKIHLR
jgi:endo-1,4-beta-xylanase